MGAERKAGSDHGRPLIDWEAAFLFYAALRPDVRVYRTVAEEFGVSVRTVERHGRELRWKERARELDRQATTAAEERLRDQRVEQLHDFHKLLEATLVSYANTLRAGKIRHSVTDLSRLYALTKSLWEDSDDHEAIVAATVGDEAQQFDPTERKLEVLRALHEVGALDELLTALDSSVAEATEPGDRSTVGEPDGLAGREVA